MRCAMRGVLAVLLACFAVAGSPPLRADAVPGVSDTYLLRATTVQVTVRSAVRGASVRCLGFVATVRDPFAYVVTAKRCVEPLVAAPLATGTPFNRLGISVTVQYPDGSTGTVQNLAWMDDVVSLVTSFARRPASYSKLCPSCSMYADFGADQTIPVALAPPGPRQAVAHGVVASDSEGNYGIAAGAAPGMSGAAVLDARNGNLVGIITVPPGAGPDGWRQARLSTGRTVSDLTRFAVTTFER